MDNDKKITVNYYANTRAKSIERDGETLSPLYARVIYNRESTQIKVLDQDGNPVYVKEDELINEDLMNVFAVNVIKQILKFEVENLGKNFKLRGLGERLRERYDQEIDKVVFKSLELSIDQMLGDVLTHNEYVFMVNNIKSIFGKLEFLRKTHPEKFVQIIGKQPQELLSSYFLLIEYFDAEDYIIPAPNVSRELFAPLVYEWIEDNHYEKFFKFLNSWDSSRANTFFFKAHPEMFDSQRVPSYFSIVHNTVVRFALGID